MIYVPGCMCWDDFSLEPMADTPTKLQRWLDMIAYLASRHFPAPVDEVWANVPAYTPGLEGSSKDKQSIRRMFERDKDELRDLGIPIETVTYTISHGAEELQGYRLAKKNFHLPYLRLVSEAGAADLLPSGSPSDFEITEDEAGAALDGLQQVASLPAFPLAREARSAFRKLAFDLDVELLDPTAVLQVEEPEAIASSGTLKALSKALLARKVVAFEYHTMTRDSSERRSVRPLGLFFQHGRWYLVGHDEARDEVRMFRVSRMRGATANRSSPGTPDYEIPPDFRLEHCVGRSAWELGGDPEESLEATVRFQFPRSLWAERNGHGRLVTEHEDGAQVRSFDIHRRDPFLRWLLSMAGDATVEGPESLRSEFRAMASRVIERHGGGGDGDA